MQTNYFIYLATFSYKIKEYLRKTLSLHYCSTNRQMEHAIYSNTYQS